VRSAHRSAENAMTNEGWGWGGDDEEEAYTGRSHVIEEVEFLESQNL